VNQARRTPFALDVGSTSVVTRRNHRRRSADSNVHVPLTDRGGSCCVVTPPLLPRLRRRPPPPSGLRRRRLRRSAGGRCRPYADLAVTISSGAPSEHIADASRQLGERSRGSSPSDRFHRLRVLRRPSASAEPRIALGPTTVTCQLDFSRAPLSRNVKQSSQAEPGSTQAYTTTASVKGVRDRPEWPRTTLPR